jgi:serine/threonine protein kinase
MAQSANDTVSADSLDYSTVPPAMGSTRNPHRPSGTSQVVTGALFGHYLIEEKIGEGGMGAVYKATQVNLKKSVALKVIPPSLTGDTSLIARFQREMEAVGQLEHPNIVRAMDAGNVQGVHYLAMEFVSGTDLRQLVLAYGPRPIAQACELVRQAALGLAHAHGRGLVHRDVKPSNLLLSNEGVVKVLDLGLARLQDTVPGEINRRAMTLAGQCMGTPDFMAPEQWEDSHNVDSRADLYALGCTLFFLLTGRAPYENAEHSTIVRKMAGHTSEPIPDLLQECPGVPRELDALYRSLLAKNANTRMASAAEVADRIQPWAEGCVEVRDAQEPRPVSRALEVATSGRKGGPIRWKLLAPLVLIVIGVFFWIVRPTPRETPRPEGRLTLSVSRDGLKDDLPMLVPLYDGEPIQLRVDVPANTSALCLLVNGAGEMQLIREIARSQEAQQVVIPAPGQALPLTGPPGTEFLFVCGTRGGALSVEQVRSHWKVAEAGGWPALPQASVVYVSPTGVTLDGLTSRNLGPAVDLEPTPEPILELLEAFRRRMLSEFDYIAGVAIRHESGSAPDN